MKKLIIVLMLFISMTLTSCVKKTLKDDIYIFFTSDIHCGVEENLGLPAVKAVVNDEKANHKYVTLVDIGDYLQGGAIGSLSNGKLIIDLMNDMEYDVATVGNHEFDYGMETLKERLNEASFDVVVSNIKYSGTKENVFENTKPYVIKDYDGIKVAFVGIVTPYSITDSTPKNFMEGDQFVYNFYSGENGTELFNRVQEVVDEARKSGADYVVALSHLGSTADCSPFDSISMIANTNGIDAVLDGHSHSIIVEDKYPNKDGKDVVLSSVGTKLQALGELIIGKDGSITTLHITEYNKKEEGIVLNLLAANKIIDDMLDIKLCDLDFDLNITDSEGIRIARSRECTVGNFVADAIRDYLQTDVAIVNGGGCRSGIKAGEITLRDLFNVNPFQNNTGSCYATGQQILDALEHSSRNTEGIYKLDGNAVGEEGGFLQVSGLKYTIDTSIESSVIKDENNMFVGFSNDNRRVKDVYVLQDGEYVPIDPEKTYTVASISYVLFGGGDGNIVFQNCEKIVDNGLVDVEVLKEYVEKCGGFLDIYRQTEGRITVK